MSPVEKNIGGRPFVGGFLIDEADLYAIQGNQRAVSHCRQKGERRCASLTQSDSGRSRSAAARYDASIRVGNALWALAGRQSQATPKNIMRRCRGRGENRFFG